MKYKIDNRSTSLIISILLIVLFQGIASPANNAERAGQESGYTDLSANLDQIFRDKSLAKTKFSVAIYSIDKKTYYYNKNMEEPLVPASTTKLFTTSAALYNLGADYRVKTIAYTDADTVINGVLNGNLFLAGFGDALLKVSDLDKIADAITARGVRSIKGNIYADGSFFDKLTSRLDYSGDRDIVQAIPPITALSLEMNTATVVVRSGSNAGSKVSAQVIPASDAFKVVINAKTILSKRKKTGVSVTQKTDNNGFQTFYVTGSLPPHKVTSYSYTYKNPELVTIGCLKQRLESGGCRVSGKILNNPESQINDKEPLILAEFSRQLIDLIRVVDKESDNYVAENVFKILGAGAGKGSNSLGARRQIQKMNDNLGINGDFCLLNDGSGLSRRNRITTGSMIRLLEAISENPALKPLENCLSIAGIDGTLRHRMINTPAEGNVHAKTGTHGNVSALTGFVKTAGGERLAFAMMFNGGSVGRYKAIENAVATYLAGLK